MQKSPDQPFVDIHCHLLPEIDDGARGWEESLQMAQIAVDEGIGTVVATPHQRGAYEHVRGMQIRQKTEQLTQLLQQQQIPLRVLPGADVRIEADLPEQIGEGEVLTLGDHGKHLLLELPHELYVPLDGLLCQLANHHLVGVLSHPERNQGLLGRRSLIPKLVDQGCLMQVTAASLLGSFGPESRRFAEWMLTEGCVHMLASDAHGARARRPLFRRAFERTTELIGWDGAVTLCCENPAAISEGRPVTPRLTGRPKRASVVSWLPWRRAG